jgi:glycosyltransferase involved in cell wall biosynthesis
MATGLDQISVCICTYKRPQMLAHLLNELERQVTENLFTYSAVVVDNDADKSAKETVEFWQSKSSFPIDYFNEPEQNIALARNKAVENAEGNYVAFIDDDEYPVADWLLHLYKTVLSFKVDGVLGPVKPHYPDNVPKWLIKSKLCERPTYKTGTILHWGDTRTGNVLLKKEIFYNPKNRFDAEHGRTGGEDVEFFKKMSEQGKVFTWCDEAPAYEVVPPERWEKEFYTQKLLRIGGLVGEKIRKRDTFLKRIYSLIKSSGWIAVLSAFLPFAYLLGQHIYIRFITKIMYNYGLIAGYMGRTIIRYRNE